MQVVMTSDPAGDGRENEDFVGAVANAAVLLDGAGIAGTESICRHGVAWYAHSLGAALLGRLSRADGQQLATLLAESIDQVADKHRATCDIADPSSPQATVSILRFSSAYVDHLTLGDSFLVIERTNGPAQVFTDEREISVRRRCSRLMEGLAADTPEYERARDRCIGLLRSQRNQPGGYWIAKDDPHAAAQARTGRLPIHDVAAAALLSNGASRIVDPYGLAHWHDLPELLRSQGPAELIGRVREAESHAVSARRSATHKAADDASIAYCTGFSRTTLAH